MPSLCYHRNQKTQIFKEISSTTKPLPGPSWWSHDQFASGPLISPYLTIFDWTSLFLNKYHWITPKHIESHHISLYLTKSYPISQNLITSDKMSQNFTISHKISICNWISLHLTIFHSISAYLMYLTESCQISPNLIESH